MSSEAPTIPDNIIDESKNFIYGEDVLVHLSDEKFYLGFIAKLRHEERKCLVKFGDNTVIWTFLKNVTKLSHKIINIQFCYVCNNVVQTDDICVCDTCANAYHRKCHKPEVTVSDISVWVCVLCSGKQKMNLSQVYNSRSTTVSKCVKLPYDLNSLQWDVQHCVNTSRTYCYCGGPGDWFISMLQCNKCLQWFHEKCITPLAYPLYIGDRFYVFLCSVCNSGSEFVRRIEMDWFDLVHLAIFNLTAYKPQEYYDVDINILPYLDKHWNSLRLPPKIFDVPVNDRKRYVINSLLKDPKRRFKFQVKKPNQYGLRLKLPPNPPCFKLPAQLPKTENILLPLLRNKLNINILPPPEQIDPILNPRLTESKYSKEGLQFLHQNSQVVMLPKSSDGKNLCIKSASPFFPAPTSIIKRRIKEQQKETYDNSSYTTEPERRRSKRVSFNFASHPVIGQPQFCSPIRKSSKNNFCDDHNEIVKHKKSVDNKLQNNSLSPIKIESDIVLHRSADLKTNLCFKSPRPILPASRSAIKRRIQEQRKETNYGSPTSPNKVIEPKRRRSLRLINYASKPAINQSQIATTTKKSIVKDLFDDNWSVKHKKLVQNVDSSVELRNCVHSYFSDKTQSIENNKYTILSKRTNLDGSEDFLLRWD